MKQCVKPESSRDLNGIFRISSEHKLTIRELRLERAETLILTSLLALTESMQPLECTEAK